MENKVGIVGQSGIRFFSKITTSISHEVKNVLAIINENAGLLEDFTLMEQRGIPIDSERLKSVSEKIKLQVKRADVIIKNLNRFGHSTDVAVQEVELNEFIGFLINLSSRQASNKGVLLELGVSDVPVKITTHPFLLLNLVWLCFNFIMDSIEEDDKTVKIEIRPEDNNRTCIVFKFKGLSDKSAQTFPSEEENALLNTLNASLEMQSEKSGAAVVLTL